MLKVHTAPTSTEASLLKLQARKRDEGNKAWLERAMKTESPESGSIVLLGGANLTHFRLRTAQSQVRRDLLPSFWSHIAIVHPDSMSTLYESSLEPPDGNFGVPRWHGIQTGTIATYDDPNRFPNIALVQWKLKTGALGENETLGTALNTAINRLYSDRGTVDISSALWSWLGYVWGIADQTNPLLRGIGLPCAILVETVFSILGIELTPGLASQSTCPEAIWQAAKWWGDFYDSEATLTEGRPKGVFHIGQPAAAVTDEQDGGGPKTPSPRKSSPRHK
jgi:hypothetical protein